MCRPDTDTWIRLGPREGALLLGLSGVPFNELRIGFGDRFTSSELSAALERFETLGLMDSRVEDSEVEAAIAVLPAPAPLVAAVVLVVAVIAVAVAGLPLVAQHVSWQGVLQGRPPLIWVAGLSLFAALLHEAGHASVAVFLGRGRLRCQLRWGWLTIVPVLRLRLAGFWSLPRAQRIVVAGAGCLSHLVLAAVSIDLWMVGLTLGGAGLPVLVWYAALNVVLACVNILPVYPLDGYWLLGLVLDRPWLWRESRGYRIASAIGLVALAAIGAGGVAARMFSGR